MTDDVTWSVCASSTKARPLELPGSGVGSNLDCQDILGISSDKLNNSLEELTILATWNQPWPVLHPDVSF